MIDPAAVVARLNALLAMDPDFAAAAFASRWPVNEALAGSEMPVDASGGVPGEHGRAGLLGVLNLLCGAVPRRGGDGMIPPISAVVADGRVVRFELSDRIRMVQT